jgi:hypothetical protein
MAVFLVLILAQGLSAEDSTASEDAWVKLSLMMDSRAYRTEAGLAQMKVLSSQLSPLQRYQFYEKYKTSGWWCLLNPVLGLGSYIQGDTVSGAILTGALVTGGVLQGVSSDRPGDHRGRESVNINNPSLYYAGAAVDLAALAYGFWAPWAFEKKENGQLRDALALN